MSAPVKAVSGQAPASQHPLASVLAVPSVPVPPDSSASAPQASSGAATPPVALDARSLPCRLRGAVRGRSGVTEENLDARAEVEEGSPESAALQRILRRRREVQAAAYVAELTDLAELWVEDAGDDGDLNAVAVGVVLRAKLGRAAGRLRDARMAVTDLPRCLAQVGSGALPPEWCDHLLRSVRGLTAAQRAFVDEQVSSWQLETLPADRFWTLLRQLVAWVDTAAAAGGTAESKRDVELVLPSEDDGTAQLTVTGPAPEILDLAKRLDRAAHAVQDAQRHALARIGAGEAGVAIPWDVHGDAARTGAPMSLGAIRYVLLTRSEIGTDGVPVPAAAVRMNLVVPVLSLLGVTDAPGMLDGTVPIPPAMARDLAANATAWHRVLTDPVTGEFLPVAATTYRPSTAMVEYLKVVDPICAVPGCSRQVVDIGESDHIQEFDHLHPGRGGATSPENLHRLCRTHHRMKTSRALDPERTDTGSTRWTVGELTSTEVEAQRDLVTQVLAADFRTAWDRYQAGLRAKRDAALERELEAAGFFARSVKDELHEEYLLRRSAQLVEYYEDWQGPAGIDPPPPPPLPPLPPPPPDPFDVPPPF